MPERKARAQCTHSDWITVDFGNWNHCSTLKFVHGYRAFAYIIMHENNKQFYTLTLNDVHGIDYNCEWFATHTVK